MILSVLVAVAAATAFATGTVMQHRAATSVPVDRGAAGPLRLVWRLLRTPGWLVGVGVVGVGFALQALSLRVGSVVVVTPVLTSSLVISLVLGFLVDRRHPGRPLPSRQQWWAALVVVAGLTLFLVVAAPSAGSVDGSQGPLALCVGAALALGVVAVLYARRTTARHGALVLGLAAGSGFGVMTLTLAAVVSLPPSQWLTTWCTAALVVLALSGGGLSQLAYQAGPLTASLPALTVMEPLVALVAAGPVFGETLAPGVGAHTEQVAGVVMLLVGLVVLARSEAVQAPAEPPGVVVPAPAAAPREEEGEGSGDACRHGTPARPS